LLLIDIDKHYHWHQLFGNKSLGQIIQLLTRLQELKAEQR
jgi:hypothetical protein